MKLGDVLRQVPGLQKRFVHYLEAQGDIRPARVQKRRIARRDYSPEDVRRIARLWDFYQRGYSLAAARALLEQETGTLCYVLVQARPRLWAEVLACLARSHRVLDAAVVYGESYDIVAKVEASRIEDALQVFHETFDRGLLLGPPHVLRAQRGFARSSPRGETGMMAYVLIKVPAKHLDGVLERLRGFEGVVEASVVYGETDMIVKVEVPDQATLDELIIRRIQGLPEVEATRTYLVVGGMHWQR